jgi:hypothetical protein
MNTLVVAEVVLVEVVAVKLMVILGVVNCGREDGSGDSADVRHQRSRHNQYAITEAMTICQFPVFTVCLFFPLALSSFLLVAMPISSCQFLLGHPV